jgi:pimeloyl-ACP methyl ester carboxylesterase
MATHETTSAVALALEPRPKEVLREFTSHYTHETVPTRFVEAEGIRYAYRRFGKADGSAALSGIFQLQHGWLGSVGDKQSLILAEHLPNAQVIVYSDSSHGAQYQHAKLFLEHVKLFLSE